MHRVTKLLPGLSVALGLAMAAMPAVAQPSSLSDLRPPEAHVRIVTSIRSLPGCRQ